MNIRKVLSAICLMLILLLSGCAKKDKKVQITKSNKTILTGTIYETSVYYFKTNIEGPKILILGGIHGDELAGWHTATRMLEYSFEYGEVVILPRANFLATQLELRYPGQNDNALYDGILYSDLNRAFPGKSSGTKTDKIAYELAKFVDEEKPDIVLDLHESRRNYVDGLLGNQVIYGNVKSSMYALDLVEEFNSIFETSNKVKFRVDSNPPQGSFNEYCSQDKNRIVFTLETDRRLDLEERIMQQMTLIKTFLQQLK